MEESEEKKSVDSAESTIDETTSVDENPIISNQKQQPPPTTKLSKWKEQFGLWMGEAINETSSTTDRELRIKNILDYLSSLKTKTISEILSPEPHCKNAELSSEYCAKGDYHYCEHVRKPNDYSDNLQKAHEYYTMSIAYAPEKSPQLALAYAKRSAVLFRAKLYADCKIDILQSIKSGCPPELRAKIYLRDAMCEKVLSSSNKDLIKKKFEKIYQWIEKMEEESRESFRKIVDKQMEIEPIDEDEFPKWNYNDYVPQLENVNTKINGLSNLVKLKYSEDYGRHIVAAKDIKIGDVIGVIEPYAKIYFPNMRYKFCCHCGEQTWSSIPCNDCPIVVFCSTHCRSEAFKQYHDIECPVFQSMVTAGIKNELFLVARILAKAVKDAGDSMNYDISLDENETTDPLKKSFTNETFDATKFSNIYKFLGHPLGSQLKLTIYGYPILLSYLFVTMTNNFCKRLSISLNNLKHDPKFISLIILAQNIMQLNTANSISVMTRGGGGGGDKKEALIHGLYPAVNFFNHSCEPSITCSLQGHAKLILTAIKPIKKGKRVFFDYGKHNLIKALSHEETTDGSTADSAEIIAKEKGLTYPSIKMIDKLTDIQRQLQDIISIIENFGKTDGKVPDFKPIVQDASELFKKTSGFRGGKKSAKFLADLVNVVENFYQNFNAPCVKLSG